MTENLPPERVTSLEGLARWFGVSVVTTRAWLRRGMPYLTKGGRGVPYTFDLLAVALWYAERDIRRQPRTGDALDVESLPPKERLDWYRSERERRLLQVQDGELIPAAEVEIEVAALVKSFIGTLDTLPDVLERDAGISGPAAEVAQRVIDAERDRLYERLSQ